MINPLNADHRTRLGRAAEYALTQISRYNRMQADTIEAYLGISSNDPDYWSWTNEGEMQGEYREALPKGNLLQLSALATQIGLAYGEPQWSASAREPEHTGTADSLQPGINRMSLLLNAGETARGVAADSFFGFGIFKTGVGVLPLSAQSATGLKVGPCLWRVRQPNFIYDITAQGSWENCAYMGDLYDIPLDAALQLYPAHADSLHEMTDALWRRDILDPYRHSGSYAPEPRVLMYDCYLPEAKLVVTWALSSRNMRELDTEPVAIRDYNGHWSGMYTVLNHLYQPDGQLPISLAESVKALHYLFNDVLHLVSEQALNAKYNPTYRQGSEKDIQKLWNADDRVPVGITGNENFGAFEVPGPTQSQTNYLSAIMALFKQMNFNLDARLGLGNLGGTATESQLVSQQANAMTAEMRRRFLRCLQLVGYQLGHLMIKDQNLYLPLSRPLLPGSDIYVDVSWQPNQVQPRSSNNIDDFDIAVESFSLKYKEPEQKLVEISSIANQIILPAMAAEAQGMPINSAKVLDTAAKLSGHAELRDWFSPLDPTRQQLKHQGSVTAQRPDVGRYVRENVTERTSGGEMGEMLNNMPTENRTTTDE